VRVVPNLYPALPLQEVVIHSPKHVWSLAEFSNFPATWGQLAYVADAWKNRAEAARAAGLKYLYAFINEGRAAGASLSHSHSQLAGLDELPSEVAAEISPGGDCRLCPIVKDERKEGTRIIAEAHGPVTALCPGASRVPYEVLIAPVHHEVDGFQSPRLESGLALLAECVKRLHAVEGRVPLNAWLHTSSLGGSELHWHIHLVPRLTALAGIELGAGIYVNVLPPELAAERLRR